MVKIYIKERMEKKTGQNIIIKGWKAQKTRQKGIHKSFCYNKIKTGIPKAPECSFFSRKHKDNRYKYSVLTPTL